jgi:hypothetical protein
MAEPQAAPEAKAEPAEPEPVPESGATTATVEPEVSEIQIRTWNLGERIPIAPQLWDANTPQVGQGVAGSAAEVDIITFEEEEEVALAVPEPPRKSPKEKQKKKRRKSRYESQRTVSSYG